MKSHISRFYDYFFNAGKILESKRLAWIDYAKGLTIILVVYHHSFLTLVNAGVKVNAWLVGANLSVYSFRMPMFFMLSGLFIEKSLRKKGPKKYIQSRAGLLLYPYILWGVIQASFGIFFSQYTYATWTWHKYIVIFYQPNATSQLWYLATLFNTAILYVFFSSFIRLDRRYQFIIGIVLYLLSPFLFFNSMIQDTTRFYVYLVLGSLISDFILNEKNFKMFSSVKLFFPLSILMFLSQYFLYRHQYLYNLEMYFDMSQLNYGTVLSHLWGMIKFTVIVIIGCAFVMNVCAMLQKAGKASFIRVIGYHSLYIYLMHVLIAVGCRMFFVNFLGYGNAFVILPIQIIAGMIGSVMIYNVCRHFGLRFLFELDQEEIRRLIRKIGIMPKFQRL